MVYISDFTEFQTKALDLLHRDPVKVRTKEPSHSIIYDNFKQHKFYYNLITNHFSLDVDSLRDEV